MSNFAKQQNIIYPLITDIPVDEKFIRDWWDTQTFDLKLKDYEGNCDLCFKKSLRKRLTIIKENPNVANWWLKQEQRFGSEKVPRFDLRTNKSIEQIIKLAKQPFQTVQDIHELSKTQCNLFDEQMDYETACFCKAT